MVLTGEFHGAVRLMKAVLEAAMTKCSKWLPGHDQAAAAKQDIPEPDELRIDIDALENWVASIRERRN